MPVSYELDPEVGFIEVRCFGHVTLDEVLFHLRRVEDDPRLPDRLDALLDLGDQTSIPESAELRGITLGLERLTKKVRWGAFAIVATSDVLFGMSRMFGVFSEPLFAQVNVFRDRESAARWLASVRPPESGASG